MGYVKIMSRNMFCNGNDCLNIVSLLSFYKNNDYAFIKFLQIAVDIFRDLPYLAVNGIIVLWYLYQVVVGTRKFFRNQNDISGSHITTKFIHKVHIYKFDKCVL